MLHVLIGGVENARARDLQRMSNCQAKNEKKRKKENFKRGKIRTTQKISSARLKKDDDKPSYYGDEYHGMLKRPEVDRLLGTKDGNYIVRESMTKPGKYSLSFV
eukprot:sb/3478057/